MSNVKTLVTQAIDDERDAKRYTTPFRTTIERVREGDLVAYIGKNPDRTPTVEFLMEVDEVAHDDLTGAFTLLFTGGHFREALAGVPMMVARRK